MTTNLKKIGIISDTHNHFDHQLNNIFADCDEIWHAGDIGNIDIIQKLENLKPVRAVYGNIDDPSIQHQFPEDLLFKIGDLRIYITHIAGKPPKYNARVLKKIKENKPNLLICGHSHILRVMPDKVNNLLYINPGASGQQGFHSIRTVVKMTITDDKISDMSAVELGRRGR